MSTHLHRHLRRGFTLIEVVIALTIILVISSVGLAIFVHAQNTAAEARVRSQMDRDARVVLDTIGRDLMFFGAGVPAGGKADLSGLGTPLVPVLRLGHEHAMAFQGDLPYPHAELSGIATIAEKDGALLGRAHRLAVASEVSGSCVPWENGAASQFRCDTTRTTLIPATYNAADACNESNRLARTCPWGMNKWIAQPGGAERVFWTFVDPGGNWYERSNEDNDLAQTSVDGTFWGIHLRHNLPSTGLRHEFRDELFDRVGGAYIAVLDRVFWAVEETGATECTPTAAGTPGDCTVRRRQCWGRLDPGNATFPAANASTFLGSSTTPVNCSTAPAAAPTGTPWETIATGVKNVTFRYFQDESTQLAAPVATASKSNVRAIEVEVSFERRIPGTTRTLTHSVKRRYFLSGREVS